MLFRSEGRRAAGAGPGPPARPVTRSNRSFLSRRLVPQSSYGFHDRREPGCRIWSGQQTRSRPAATGRAWGPGPAPAARRPSPAARPPP